MLGAHRSERDELVRAGRSELTVVSNDDDGRAFVGNAAQGGGDGVEVPGVDARRGFVEDDDSAPSGSRSCDDEALLLSSRQAEGMAVPQVSEVEVSQKLLPGLAAGLRRPDRQLAR